MCIVSWDFHSLSIGTFCIVSDFFFPFWTVLKGVSTVPYVLQLNGVYFSSSGSISCLIKC